MYFRTICDSIKRFVTHPPTLKQKRVDDLKLLLKQNPPSNKLEGGKKIAMKKKNYHHLEVVTFKYS